MISMGSYITLVLVSVFLLITFTLGETQTNLQVKGYTKTVQVEQGHDLSVSCHDSESSWTGPNGYRASSEWLNISRVARSDAGKYDCDNKAVGNLLSVDLDVTYPAKIVSITVPKHELSMREDFTMQIQVEGNPPPETRLTFVPEDKVVFEKTGQGKYNIVVKNLNCTDGGIYELTCNNSLATKHVEETVTVMNKPGLDPMFLPDQRILPRLGDSTNFTAHIISCPPVLFFDWTHNSTPDKHHDDTNSSSVLFLDDVDIASYGGYELKLQNKLGNVSIPFFAEAFGPPAAISDLDVSDVTNKDANISFISGFDYNDTQTFMVMREVDGELEILRNVKDVPHDNGKPRSFVITDLQETTPYNITVVAHNTRGNSEPASTFVAFTTFGSPKPDPKFPINHTTTPRLGDAVNFTIHCLADPEPMFRWFHNGKHVESLDSNNTCGSTIMLDDIAVDDFGSYMLQMENDYGQYNVSFEMKATGPPASISDLDVYDITDKSANISFTSGYDYNATQTFMVLREVDGQLENLKNLSDVPHDKGRPRSFEITDLDDTTSYNITIIAHNTRGNSESASTFVAFTTCGSPKPDPKFPIHPTSTPRLGDSVNFTIHCLANPEPMFRWLHNGKHVKSLDSNTTCGSTVMVNKIVVDDFGSYMLQMENDYGDYNVSFEMKAAGPPAPVSDLKITNVSTSAATITFITGFNYNSTQTFVVKQQSGGKVQDITACNDTTDGKGGAELSCEIDNLKYFTEYHVTVASKNDAGSAIPSTGFIAFTTYGAPKPDPKYPITKKHRPRTSDVVDLTLHAIGEPAPTYEWIHNGKVYNSSDKGYISTLQLDGVKVEEFGNYTVNVSNVVGSYETEFFLIPDGPPDSVTDLQIADVNTSSANLKFKTGYNYEKKQVFIVLHNEDGHPEVMTECNDTTTGKGGAPFSCKLDKLKQDTLYNVTVMSENSEGESNSSKDFIQFSTYGAPKPDPKFPVKDKFKPRLGQSVTLTAHAVGYPIPRFEWMHNGKPVKSDDTQYTSMVQLAVTAADEFGNYSVNITNTAGSYVTDYDVIADGPPSQVTNLVAGNLSETSVTLQWTAGFNYGNKQDFRIMQEMQNGVDTELRDVDDVTDGKGDQVEATSLSGLVGGTTYSVYLIAENTRGNATKSDKVTFTTNAPKGSSGPSAAAIAGIVIGVLAVVVLVAIVVIVIRRRRAQYEQFGEERQPRHYSYDDRP